MTFNFPYGFNFLHISELMLLGPLALLVLLGLRKKINKRHLFFHALVIFLLVLALAAPYSAEMSSPKINQTRITIISDESASMELLEQGVAGEIADNLNTRVPVTVTTISGMHTSLGDAIIQQASPENYVLVISDGQSNSGTPVEDALSYCYKNNFPVSALIPKTIKEDLSVEIEGENEAVIDNQAFFKVNIRKSTEKKMSYQVRITVDHRKVLEREITQTGRMESIEFNHTFETLGPHTVKATLHPAGISVKNLDYFENNNQYMKSVYVTPKPKVLLVTNEPDSPLANTMREIYDVRVSGSFGSLEGTDAVVIDNQAASTISDIEARTLKNYIINGGGMVVIGGGSSFDYPAENTYQDTRFEELLPVTSKPSNWRGGRNIVLMLDVSPSTLQSNGVGGRILDDILSNAIVLLESGLFKDARVDVITFGSKGQDISNGFVDMSKESNRLWLDAEIRKITPTGDSTSLERGLMTARTLLKEQNSSAEAEIIIVSDGGIGNIAEGDLRFEHAVQCAENLHENNGIGIHFVHIHAPKTNYQVTSKGQYYAELFMNKISLSENYNRIEPGERVKVRFSEDPMESEDRDDEYSSGSIVVYDPKHFITRNISDIKHDILGYNEVTPRPEANRLVITRLGKPIVTVWRMGLGRVAAITTDNGKGNGVPWAASLYSGNDSMIIMRTLNWAVADTETEGIRLDVPDLKMGQPGRILITTGKEGTPELYFDKKPMEIKSIGNNMYESYVTADSFGLHKISETPVEEVNLTEELMYEASGGARNLSWRPAAVNRPDEYTYVGENSLFRTAILETGGKIYTKGDIYSKILEDASASIEKKVMTNVFYTKYFLVLAFLIYLLYTLHHTYNTRMK